MTIHSPEVTGEEDQAAAPVLRSYDSFIGGVDVSSEQWVYTVSGQALLEDVFSAMTLKRRLEADPESDAAAHPYVVGRVAFAGLDELDAAVEAAAAAAPVWARADLDTRLGLGDRFRETLREHHAEFVDVLIAEGHPRMLAEWEFTCLQQVFSPESIAWYREQMHREDDSDASRRLIVRRQADGVVGFNPPQNAPAPSAGLAVAVLMAGNAVVVRAPRSIPLSTMYILRDLVAPLLEEIGAPAGVLNAVCGQPKAMLDHWVAHPKVNDIFYIGSSEEGLRLQSACQETGTKPILELAGNDGLVVWRDADLDRAVEAITECFFGSGQICMVPKWVVAHPAIADDLIERLQRWTTAVQPGSPDDPDVLLAPVRRSEKYFRQLRQALSEGAELVTGGRRLEADGTPSDDGVFLEPTVLRVDGLVDARRYDVVAHETFYPMIPVVVPGATDDEALLDLVIDFLNDNEYGLRNSVWTGSEEIIDRFVREVRNAGLLKINDSHIGFLPVLPTHGGTGLTGGASGEANYPILTTSHLQGVSVATDVRPRDALFGR